MALWLALVMLFGMFAPTGLVPGMGPVEVQGTPVPATDWAGNRLRAINAQRMVGGTADMPMVSLINEYSNPEDILLAFPVSMTPENRGLHVLRFFNNVGDKFEFWVETLPIVDDEPTIDTVFISYHLFPRIQGATTAPLYNAPISVSGGAMAGVMEHPSIQGSFPFPGRPQITLRYRWNPPEIATIPGMMPLQNHMFFFIEGGLSNGLIHDFRWEFYSAFEAGDNAAVYADLTHDIHFDVWQPGESRGAGYPVYRPGYACVAFVFPGFDTQDINVFPFAHAVKRDPILMDHQYVNPEDFPHIYPPTATSYDDLIFLPHTLHGSFWDRQRALPAYHLAGTAGVDFPSYTFHRINMTGYQGAENMDPVYVPVEWPAMGRNGLDMRILLPRFFDERYGRFVGDFRDGPPCDSFMPSVTSIINMGTSGGYSYNVSIMNVADLPLWSVNGENNIPPGSSLTPPGNVQRLLDVSMLETVGSAGLPGLPVVRVLVDGLPASTIYDLVRISFSPAGSPMAAPRLQNRTTELHHGPDLQLNTFLNFNFTAAIAGMMNVTIRPFRNHFGALLVGEYRFDMSATPGISDSPIRTQFDGRTNAIEMPVFVEAGQDPVHYFLTFVQAGGGFINSQIVIILPEDRPGAGPPNGFRVIPGSLHFQPMRLPAEQPPGSAADLSFGVEWQVGDALSITRMFDQVSGGVVIGQHDQITIRYTLYRGLSPQTADEAPTTTLAFADIDVILTPVTGGALISYEVRFPHFPELDFSTDPEPWTVVNDIVFASIHFENLIGAHLNNRPVNPLPPALQPAGAWFNFPYVYHLYVAPKEEQLGSASPFHPLTGWPNSVFDYIVLDDFDALNPPPPTNFAVATQTNPDEPPALQVTFEVPTQALRTYLAQQYPFNPVVRFNVYVSAFENTLSTLKDPENDLRESAAHVVDVNFAERISRVDDVNFIDLTDFLPVLREGVQVVRITDIPLAPASIFNSLEWLDSGIWDDTQALHYTGLVLNVNPLPLPFSLGFTVTGLDENLQYFLFADLVVERFVSADAMLDGEWEGKRIIEMNEYVINRSVPTVLTGDVTIGTPQVPGPIEVDPSAPTGIGHQGLDQASVILYWNEIVSKDPATVAVEFEIVRTFNNRLDLDNLGNLSLDEIVRRVPESVGWRTNYITGAFVPGETEPFLTVYHQGVTEPIDPIRPIFNEDQPYAYDRYFDLTAPARVALFDRTLRPNSLYFYYVRTIQRVLFTDPSGEEHILENRSSWVEESVTTPVVQAPEDLRIEDGQARLGFDPFTQQFVSWTHPATQIIMQALLENPDAGLVFQYQLRADEGNWGEIITVPLHVMTNPESFINGRFYYLVRGLSTGTVYQMRVRVQDRDSGDTSVWSNIITFMTDWDDSLYQLEREADDWLEHLRRILMEQVRRPYWVSIDTPDNLRVVYRPDHFRGMMDAVPGTTVPLFSTGARNAIYYLPVSGLLEANEARRGFLIGFEDMDILFDPRFINQNQNRAILDMARYLDNRTVNVIDYFVRITITRDEMTGLLHGNEPISYATDIQVDLVAVNNSTRNIRAWDSRMQNRAEQLIRNRIEDPLLRQNIINIITRDEFQGDRRSYVMLDFLDDVIEDVTLQINRMVTVDVPIEANNVGIIAPQRIPVVAFDAPMHVIATNNTPSMSVNGFSRVRTAAVTEWVAAPVTQQLNGYALVTQVPGGFAFSGREINIEGIESIPQGQTITTLVARFNLDFGPGDIDLYRNATRTMVTDSIARIAGAPANTDSVNWVATNLNVTLANRNAQGLVSQQEAIAMVMALYERRTGTWVASMLIRNQQATAGLMLDNRYAQAVRVAFELGILNDYNFQPANPVTIGDLLAMLSALDARVGL